MAEQLVIGGDRRRRPGVGRQLGETALGQRHDVASGPDRFIDGVWMVVGLGELAGLQRDRVRGQRAGAQRGGQAGDDVLVGHVPVQQQDLDQGAGAGGVAVGLADGFPPGVVHRGELARGPGLLERGGTGRAPGLRSSASR